MYSYYRSFSKIGHSNFVHKQLFFCKTDKPRLKVRFLNYFGNFIHFRQSTPISSCTCWWWLPSALVSQPFPNRRSPMSLEIIRHRRIYLISYSVNLQRTLRDRSLCPQRALFGGCPLFRGCLIPRPPFLSSGQFITFQLTLTWITCLMKWQTMALLVGKENPNCWIFRETALTRRSI